MEYCAYIVVPENAPAAPRPLIARPMMNEGDVGAAAERTDPIVKSDIDIVKRVFME